MPTWNEPPDKLLQTTAGGSVKGRAVVALAGPLLIPSDAGTVRSDVDQPRVDGVHETPGALGRIRLLGETVEHGCVYTQLQQACLRLRCLLQEADY